MLRVAVPRWTYNVVNVGMPVKGPLLGLAHWPLEADDDVQDVYANFDIPERVLEAVAG